MPLGTIFGNVVLQKAGIAYIHYLSFMICFGALVLERKILKVSPDRKEAITLLLADVVYGVAALLLLLSGLLRVLYLGQGSEFYTQNPIFWIKITIFIGVGLLSLYPTFTYILWAIPLSKGELPKVDSILVERITKIINIELIGFIMIPLFATLMARGVGLG
ncbi:DUF2214 family protein [Prochlorococcus sp. MIT 1223]|uniref:DUF2214 family protein n=1 Tax=Prochlorococcus sp. MIT 1223 TaxID=3096217 RepID=UPI002A747823|nr:DUF2214 family protein [Prochlorococcus sp. MIT 1223]